MDWERALELMAEAVNDFGGDDEFDLRMEPDIASDPMGAKIYFKEAGQEQDWKLLGVFRVSEGDA